MTSSLVQKKTFQDSSSESSKIYPPNEKGAREQVLQHHVTNIEIKKSIHCSEVMLWSVNSVFSVSISLCRQATLVWDLIRSCFKRWLSCRHKDKRRDDPCVKLQAETWDKTPSGTLNRCYAMTNAVSPSSAHWSSSSKPDSRPSQWCSCTYLRSDGSHIIDSGHKKPTN